MELRQNKLKGFTVLDPVNLFPGDYNSLYPMKKDYYKPKYWYVLGTKVHSSRLIRLVANECPTLLKPAYNFFGIPQAQLLYDYVLHFQDCRIAVTRLLKKFSLLTFKTNIGEILYAQGGTQEIDARINFMLRTMNNQGVWVMDTTEEAQKLESSGKISSSWPPSTARLRSSCWESVRLDLTQLVKATYGTTMTMCCRSATRCSVMAWRPC